MTPILLSAQAGTTVTYMALNFPLYFARAVRERMAEQGMSELSLHKATLIPRSTLSRRLDGEDIRSTEMKRIATALGTTVSDLAAAAERIESERAA